ncbi:MAG: DUF484 family protein [Gammaproteobacteria bacterium]|jgi:hypothetical protein
MTQQQQIDAAATPAESDIADYLARHPDFFERHASLLIKMRLPHAPSGATISLVERQIALLRQQNDKLQRNLKELVAVAKQNDTIAAKIHKLGLAFLHESQRSARLEQLETSLREDFGAHRAVIVLFEQPSDAGDAGFIRYANRDDAQLRPFSMFLSAAKTRCGLLREKQKQYLFGEDGDMLGSAAMVPLGDQASQGFLVIGNRSKDHFNPSGQTDFLERLGELVATAIAGESPASERAASE